MANTPRLGLRNPAGGDAFNIASDLSQIAGILDNAAIDQSGTFAARPAANAVKPGTFYFSTDTGDLSRSNGTIWFTLTPMACSMVRASGTVGLAWELGPVTAQKVTFGTEVFDLGGDFSNSRFTARVKGFYEINFRQLMQSNWGALKNIDAQIYKNGAFSESMQGALQGPGVSDALLQATTIIQLNAADYIEIYLAAGNTINSSGTDSVGNPGSRLSVKLLAQVP